MIKHLIRWFQPQVSAPPFLPLVFRVAVGLGLMLIQLVLPKESPHFLPGETLYLSGLACFIVEGIVEATYRKQSMGRALGTPGLWVIRINLLMDLGLVALIIAFQGSELEGYRSFLLFPILASAFYLDSLGIVAIGLSATVVYAALVLGFSQGWLAAFGGSGQVGRSGIASQVDVPGGGVDGQGIADVGPRPAEIGGLGEGGERGWEAGHEGIGATGIGGLGAPGRAGQVG